MKETVENFVAAMKSYLDELCEGETETAKLLIEGAQSSDVYAVEQELKNSFSGFRQSAREFFICLEAIKNGKTIKCCDCGCWVAPVNSRKYEDGDTACYLCYSETEEGERAAIEESKVAHAESKEGEK